MLYMYYCIEPGLYIYTNILSKLSTKCFSNAPFMTMVLWHSIFSFFCNHIHHLNSNCINVQMAVYKSYRWLFPCVIMPPPVCHSFCQFLYILAFASKRRIYQSLSLAAKVDLDTECGLIWLMQKTIWAMPENCKKFYRTNSYSCMLQIWTLTDSIYIYIYIYIYICDL